MSHDLTDRALDFVRQSSEDEFMLYVHYFDPHGPYDPPEELMRRFTDTVHPEPVGLYTQLRPELDRYLGEGFGPGEARYEDQQLRYDAEIVDVDDAIRALFDGLDALGVADDTLVVLTSDHGEEFLDHGYIEHAWTLYDESIHVPLVFWAPGALEPSRVAEPASLADVLPSVVALMGMPDNGRTYDGRALFDARGQSSRVTAPIVSELLVHHRNVMRAVTLGEWKYIQARQFLTPEGRTQLVQRGEGRAQKQLESVPFDPWSPIVREELFNLRDDPRETTNLSLAEPARLAQMRAVLADFEARARELAPAQQGTAEELSQDEEMAERIRAIGY
jgi:arylsulfatase A-like enzyme